MAPRTAAAPRGGADSRRLATHYNDMPVPPWRALVLGTGAARFAYCDDLLGQGEGDDSRIRHRAYLHARHAWIAALLDPLLTVAGAALLAAALRALRSDRAIAYSAYVLALGCTDLAGYCRACVQQASRSRRSRAPQHERGAATLNAAARPGPRAAPFALRLRPSAHDKD